LALDVVTGYNTTLQFAQAGSAKWYLQNLDSTNAFRFYDATASAERMRIDSSGNVGIGTTSPNISGGSAGSQTLTVSASASARNALIELKGTRTSANQVSSYIRSFSNSGATPGVDIQFYRGTTDTDGFLTISTSGSESARIDSSGNFMVGATATNAGAKAYVNFSTAGGSNGLLLTDSSNSSGTTFAFFIETGVGQIGSITRVGATSAVVYNTTSDYRLKTVIGTVSGQGERIDALKPIDYQWKEGGQQARGFLAHEFQTVYPNSVSGDKDAVDADGKPKYQAMQAATSEVIADLVAEIQSLRARVAQLETKGV